MTSVVNEVDGLLMVRRVNILGINQDGGKYKGGENSDDYVIPQIQTSECFHLLSASSIKKGSPTLHVPADKIPEVARRSVTGDTLMSCSVFPRQRKCKQIR